MVPAPEKTALSPWRIALGVFAALVLSPILALTVVMALLPACIVLMPVLVFDFWREEKEGLVPERHMAALPPAPRPVGA